VEAGNMVDLASPPVRMEEEACDGEDEGDVTFELVSGAAPFAGGGVVIMPAISSDHRRMLKDLAVICVVRYATNFLASMSLIPKANSRS